MQKMIEQLIQWTYLQKLPPKLHGFELTIEKKEDGTQYRLFSYYHKEKDRHFSVLYDHATKEYIARWRIGLTEFCDVNFIASKLEMLEGLLSARLEGALGSMAVFNPQTLGSIFLGKKILEWPYAKELPPYLHGFSLAVSPCEPLKSINGSYIIIDYSDVREKSRLLIYYNIYRDDFYGEIVFRSTPQMITHFDAAALSDLESKIKASLEPVLAELRHRLASGE